MGNIIRFPGRDERKERNHGKKAKETDKPVLTPSEVEENNMLSFGANQKKDFINVSLSDLNDADMVVEELEIKMSDGSEWSIASEVFADIYGRRIAGMKKYRPEEEVEVYIDAFSKFMEDNDIRNDFVSKLSWSDVSDYAVVTKHPKNANYDKDWMISKNKNFVPVKDA